MIKDAAYEIVLNDTLRREFVKIYNAFPALYDKHKNKYAGHLKRIYLEHYDDYQKVACVLEEATKDDELLGKIQKIIFGYFGTMVGLPKKDVKSLKRKLKRKGYISNEIAKELYDEQNQELHRDYVNRVVKLADIMKNEVQYEFKSVYKYAKEYMSVVEERAREIDADRLQCLGMIAFAQTMPKVGCSDSFDETASRLDKELKESIELTGFWETIYTLAVATFGKDRENENLWATHLNANFTYAEAEQMYIDRLCEEGERVFDNPVAVSGESKVDAQLYFDYMTVLCLLRYLRTGVDAPMIFLKEPLENKEIKLVVYLVKRSMETFFNPRSEEDMVMCAGEVVRALLQEQIIKSYKKAVTPVSKKKEKGSSSLEKTLLKLKEENERLAKITEEAKAEVEKEKAKRNSEVKELTKEIYRLKKELKNEEPTETKEEAAEEVAEEETEVAREYTEEDFIKFIENKNVLVWGLRDKIAKRMEEKYPRLAFMASNEKLMAQQLSQYDAVIMSVDYTSHAGYYYARDMIKNAGLPIATLPRASTSERWLVQAGEELERVIS